MRRFFLEPIEKNHSQNNLRGMLGQEVDMATNRPSHRLTSGWGLTCLVPLVLLGICYLRIWGDAGSAAFGGKIIEAALAQPVWGTALGNNLMFFLLAQIVLHLALGVVCIALGLISDYAWRTPSCKRRDWMLLWSIFITIWILIANAAWFPTSSLGSPYANVAAANWNGITPLHVVCGLLLAGGTATILRAISRIRLGNFRLVTRLVVPAASLLLVISIAASIRPVAASRPTQSQPNVFIIGVDSLRFDALHKGDTPAIDQFLAKSVMFSNASTPLARTFPAWVSLLSGRHPHTTGATMNLLPRELIRTGETLPQLLTRAGYRSIYAIDEVRFSNLDTSYGFDQMITPPIGATDFILGFFGDAPLSNIMVNTPVGRVLFPYAYANRAASLTYDPDTFVQRIESNIRTNDPVFLAAHFTLAHWPYMWAGSPEITSADTPEGVYRRAVKRVDQQFAAFMSVLQEHGLLDNAIVVVLSDHGESLGDGCDEDSGSAMAEAVFNRSKIFGHGTSVFTEAQYHVVLGMRSFGQTPLNSPAQGRTIAAPVSLEDVTPTIVDLLSLRSEGNFDGVSLVPLLQGHKPQSDIFASRVRFTETEFNPGGIVIGKYISSSALRSAASYYRVDPVTDRVTMRKDDVEEIMGKRQYAAFRDGKLLAAFPSQNLTIPGLRLAYVSHEGALPEKLVDEAAIQARPEAAALWRAMQERFPGLKSKTVFPRDTALALQ